VLIAHEEKLDGNRFVWIELIAVFGCVYQRLLETEADFGTELFGNICEKQIENRAEMEGGGKADITPFATSTGTQGDGDHLKTSQDSS